MDTSDSEIYENSKNSISKNRKEKKKSKDYINSLTPAFVQDALSKIMKFYSDDAVASMTFNKLDENECYFFSNFRGVLDSKKLKSCFNKCQRLMIEKIKNVSASKTNYKLAIKKTKMWDPLDKAITFSKVPVYNPAQRIWADMITKKENIALNTADRSVSKDKGKIQISVNTEAKEFKDKAESTRTTYRINVDKLIDAAETTKENVAVYLKTNNIKNESSNKMNANVNTVASDRSDRNIKTTSNNVNINASTVTSDGSDRKDKIVNSNMLTAKVSKLDSDRSDRSVGKDKSGNSNKLDANASTIDSDRSDRSVNKDKRSIGISFQKGSVLDLRNSDSSMNTGNGIDKPEAERNKDGVAQSGQVLNNRKSKLLEAMSVPLKSDKAMKMMLVMGWEGGALGLRGEGITEPIIPALDLPKGAGLGHTPPPKSKPTNDFRIELVHVIHDFLLSDDESKTIGFQAKLTTKEVKTLNNVVKCFGNRTRMELVFGQLAIADAVMRMLHAKSILLTSSLSADKKEIRLVKVPITSPDITNKGLRKMQRMALIQDKLSRMSVTINLGKAVDNACLKKKSYLLLEFKIDTLVAILEFFKRSEKKMTWRAGDTMNKKKIAYIDKAVRSLNEKSRFGDTEPEMALAAQILNSMGDYELELKFLNFNTSFTITKIYNNRFSPQGTSTPEEETIDNIKSVTKTATVDQNSNKITPIESNLYSDSHTQSEATDDPSTDDVIIIEGRMSPIVVSDEENSLLKSVSDAVDIETDLDQTSPAIDLSVKCDNFDGNLKDLEQAIFDADDIKKEDSPSIKRSRSDSLTSDTKIPKKIKYETKKVHIVHSNYPDDMLSKDNIATIQKIISDNILNSNELPLLKCHGVQDGGLVYSCHTIKSYDWLKSTLGVASDVKILDTKDVLDDGYKMSLKFNCYFEFNVDYLFSMLEMYNKDLSTSKWLLLKQTVFLNHVCFVVKVDASSYFYVRSKGYCLFAGVDEVQFSIICD